MKNKKYDSSSILVLKGLDAVKKRPGMYIGNIEDGTGFHHMVFEIIDNSIDESLEGYCNEINVKMYIDNSISIEDNGRGIPVEYHEKYKKSSLEIIMTTLHSGAKFNNEIYNISGGLHGVGISVVNALSSKLEIIIKRNNKIYRQIYINGYPEKDIEIVGKSLETGTFIRFWPNLNIFKNNNLFKYDILYKKLKEISFLNSNIKINLYDEKSSKYDKFYNPNGLKSYILDISKRYKLIHKKYFYINTVIKEINLEVILQWTNLNKYKYYCFTNNTKQLDGGSHLSALKSSITKTINIYIEKEFNKKNKYNIIGDDVREGLISIISIKMKNPKFSSQTKDKLISSEIKPIIESVISEKLMDFLLENVIESKLIINKIIQSSILREAAKKAKEIIKRKNQIDSNNLIGKLSECQEKNPNLTELYLVEGDSAGGSAKQARNRKNQAVLSLKGKILNVEKSNIDKILFSKEISNLIIAIGCNIEKNIFNIDKLKYYKIIIMTDADVDGSHIRTLLLTFFYRYIPDLIKKGYLYIAQPPLYKITINKKEIYIKDDKEFNNYKISFIIRNLKKKIVNNNLNSLKEIVIYYLENIKNIFLELRNKISSFFLIEFIIFSNFLENINNYDFFKKKIIDFIFYINKKMNINKYKIIIKKEGIILKEFKNGIYINYDIKQSFFYTNEVNKILNFIKKFNTFIKNSNSNISLSNFIKDINLLDIESLNNSYIHRYKGLGEMNPNQLWETTMNPENRTIFKININNNEYADNLFNILMGESVELRKKFIEENYIFAKNIDI